MLYNMPKLGSRDVDPGSLMVETESLPRATWSLWLQYDFVEVLYTQMERQSEINLKYPPFKWVLKVLIIFLFY